MLERRKHETRSKLFIVGSKYRNLEKKLRGVMVRIVGFNAKIADR